MTPWENGYRLALTPPVDLQTVWNLIEGFRARAEGALYETLCRQTAEICALVIDQRALEMPAVVGRLEYSAFEEPLAVAYHLILRRFQAAYELGRGADQELDAHLTLLPGTPGADILMLLHTRNVAVKAAWEATAGVEPFPYFRAPEMSEAEWGVRSGIWADALTRPMTGLRVECLGRYGLPVPTVEDVLPYVPIRKDRAVLLGADRALGAWLRRQAVTDEQHVPTIVLQGVLWLQGEREGNAMATGEAQEIEPLLPLIDYESFSV